MPRGNLNSEEDGVLPGQDSFLDIIANMVGIIIILVMVVGVRASHHVTSGNAQHRIGSLNGVSLVPNQSADKVAALRADVKQASKQIMVSRAEIETIAGRIESMFHEAELQDQQRIRLNMHRALVEEDMQKRRAQLSSTQQREYDVQRQIGESQIHLDELAREHLALASAPPIVEKVETVTTPLARQVQGEEIHLRLKGGLVSVVPVQSLVNQVYPRLDQLRRTLHERGHVLETFGPIEGYRLRLTFARTIASQSFATPAHFQPTGSNPRRSQVEQNFKFLPVSEHLGQNVEQALLPGAPLQKLLAAHRREATPVTLWIYTDSFAEFRTLKRALWEMNFPVAVRPMAMGDQITASPNGTRSSAQ
jgi:hypothetical protein